MQIKITMRYPVTPNILVNTRKLDATRMVDCGGRAQGKWVWGMRIENQPVKLFLCLHSIYHHQKL